MKQQNIRTSVLTAERVIHKRYFIFKIWNFRLRSQAEFEETVDAVVETGCNAIKIHVPWTKVEVTRGAYDLAPFVDMADYVIRKKGLPVAFCIDVSRDIDDGLFPPSEFMLKRDGTAALSGGSGKWAQISFSSPDTVAHAVKFYRTAVRHFHERFGENVLFYLPTFSQFAETEYYPAVELDYSPHALKAFHSFLKGKYGEIGALNYVLNSAYASFDEVVPPSGRDMDNLGILWYQFRHKQIKAIVDALADAQHAVAPGSKFCVQFGSVFDSPICLRGNAAFADLCEKVDVIFVDDAPVYNHLWSMDYIRHNLPPHVEYGNDIDGPLAPRCSPDAYYRQCVESYEKGATYITLSNWTVGEAYRHYEPVWKRVIAEWLHADAPKTVLPKLKNKDLNISLSEMIQCKSYLCFYYYVKEYERLTADGETDVRIHLIDDLTTQKVDKPKKVYFFWDEYGGPDICGPWRYVSVEGDRCSPMMYDETTVTWKHEHGLPLVRREGAIPADASDAGVEFRSPLTGKVVYTFTVRAREEEEDFCCLYIRHNGQNVFPCEEEAYRLDVGRVVRSHLILDVKKGDTILLGVKKHQKAIKEHVHFDLRVETLD